LMRLRLTRRLRIWLFACAIGRRLGKSRPYVSGRVKLLRLHPELREAVRSGKLTPDHAQPS